MGRTTFLKTLHYIFHLALLMSLCYVNIYHKNFLYGGLLKVIVSMHPGVVDPCEKVTLEEPRYCFMVWKYGTT